MLVEDMHFVCCQKAKWASSGEEFDSLELMVLCIIGKLLFTVLQKESLHMSSSTPCVRELKFNVDKSAKGKPRQATRGLEGILQ